MADSRNSPAIHIVAKGHRNVRASHAGSFELTEDTELTPSGTCIIGVEVCANAGQLRELRGQVSIVISCSGFEETVSGMINPRYLLGEPLIFRTHQRPQWRSFCIACDKDAAKLNRSLVQAMQLEGAVIDVRITEMNDVQSAQGMLYAISHIPDTAQELTPRMTAILQSVDAVVLCDTRQQQAISSVTSADVETIVLDPQRDAESTQTILDKLSAGARIALLLDDTDGHNTQAGARLVDEAAAQGCLVSSGSGSDVIAVALAVSGFSGPGYEYHGRLPKPVTERNIALNNINHSSRTGVFQDNHKRLPKTLERLCDIADHKRIAVCLDLMTRNERIIRGSPAVVMDLLQHEKPQGKVVVVVEASQSESAEFEPSAEITAFVDSLIEAGIATKTITKALVQTTGVHRRMAFDFVLARRAQVADSVNSEFDDL